MPGSVFPKPLYESTENDLFESYVAPQVRSLQTAISGVQQSALQAAARLEEQAAPAVESVRSWKLPSPMELFGLADPEATAATPAQPTTAPSRSWKLPSPFDLFGAPEPEPAATTTTTAARPAAGTPVAMPSASRPTSAGSPSFSSGKSPEGQSRVYQTAINSGLDDEGARVLVAVTETEGGWGGAIGDEGQSRGIYQMHERGEMPGFRAWVREQGIPGDPNQLAYDPEVATRYAATTYLGNAVKQGRAMGLSGPDLATFVQRTGQRSVRPETTGENYSRLFGAGARPGATPAEQTPAAQAQAPRWGTYTPETLTPNQFSEGREQGLSAAEAAAVCGPAAAVAFARANGRNPTLREAKELGQSLGVWSTAGMKGPASQVTLLQKMGVPARLQTGADWGQIAREVQSGHPVILDSPGHYWVATGYDPRTGEFELGASAGVLTAARGKTRWRPEEIPSLGMGDIRSTIFLGQ
jgi:hypothetical protein